MELEVLMVTAVPVTRCHGCQKLAFEQPQTLTSACELYQTNQTIQAFPRLQDWKNSMPSSELAPGKAAWVVA